MLASLIKIGQFLRILDENAQLSITNISMILSLYKLMTAPNASYTEVGAFLVSMAAYSFKKTVSGPSDGT